MKQTLSYFLFFLLAVLHPEKHLFAQRYPFYNLNVESGLIQSQVRGGMAQDKAGNLWIATLGGISKYDGKNFTNYTVRDGLLNNDVNTITADENGTIWIGNARGISQVGDKGFIHYSFKPAEVEKENDVTKIIPFNKELWCITNGKIVKFKTGNTIQVPLPAHIKATALLVHKEGLIIAADNGKIYTHHNHVLDSALIPSKDKAYTFTILQDKRNRILLATNKGLYVVKEKTITPFFINKRAINFAVTSLAEDNSGALWAGTASGVVMLTDSSLYWFNKKNGLSDNPFYQVLADKEGNIWMASDGQGVFRFSGAEFSSLDERCGLPSAQVMSIATDHKGKLFLGTYEAGLYSFENGKISDVKLPQGYTAVMAMCYAQDTLWMGISGGGLVGYNGSRFKIFTTKNAPLPSNHVSSLYYDEHDRLWIGTLNGLVCKQHDDWLKIPLPNNTAIRDIINIGSDSVLFATTSGIKLYHQGKVIDFITKQAPDSANPQCFLKHGNELWIGTSDNGLIYYHLRSKKSFVLNKSNGLQSDFIYNIMDDNDDNIWIGTGYGIHKIVYKNRTKPEIHFYGKEQGISGMESNHKSVLKMPDGSIWFGTTNGATHYIPSNKNVVAHPISIVMQAVKLFGEDISDTSYFDSTDYWYKTPYGLRLPYKKNNLSFTFHAVSLTADEQLIYRYRIKGLDAPWSEWSEVNTVTYSALPPGKYVLEMQSKSSENDKNLSELSYSFEIITPFPQTSLFRFIILGACILLGITLQYIANRRKQNRLKLVQALRKEEQDKVRQRTAEDFHDEVGNKLTRINVLTNVLKSKIELSTPDAAPDATQIINQIQDNTGQLYSGTRDILWSLKPSNDTLYQILYHIRDFGIELFQYTPTEFSFDIARAASDHYRLPLDVSRNLIMIFKEAMNNCLKYSSAKKVMLEATLLEDDRLELRFIDNGKGFDMEHINRGHGLDNMHIRAQRINGQLSIKSELGKGTQIILNFRPLRDLPLKRG